MTRTVAMIWRDAEGEGSILLLHTIEAFQSPVMSCLRQANQVVGLLLFPGVVLFRTSLSFGSGSGRSMFSVFNGKLLNGIDKVPINL